MAIRGSHTRVSMLLAGLLAGWLGPVDSRAQASPSAASAYSVEAVRAAYLVNFIRFSEWPAGQAGTPFVIGVLGNRELEDRLIATAEGKQIQGRKIRVRHLATPSDALECQLVYLHPVPRTETSAFSIEDWLQSVRGHPVLTVSADEGFLQKGGIINFYAENKNLRFEISPRAAELAGVQLSSRLLAIARVVKVELPPRRAP